MASGEIVITPVANPAYAKLLTSESAAGSAAGSGVAWALFVFSLSSGGPGGTGSYGTESLFSSAALPPFFCLRAALGVLAERFQPLRVNTSGIKLLKSEPNIYLNIKPSLVKAI